MAAKPKTTMVSNFPGVKKASHEAIRRSRDLALNAGEGEAERRLEMIDNTRGYELPIDIGQENEGLGGKIEYSQWYGRFFEYGTVHIPAAPFMRPAHRRMRKVFKDTMQDDFEGFVKRRAGMRKR